MPVYAILKLVYTLARPGSWSGGGTLPAQNAGLTNIECVQTYLLSALSRSLGQTVASSCMIVVKLPVTKARTFSLGPLFPSHYAKIDECLIRMQC